MRNQANVSSRQKISKQNVVRGQSNVLTSNKTKRKLVSDMPQYINF